MINTDEKLDRFVEVVNQIGRDSVPKNFINGKHIGGFDDISELDMDGELESLLGL